MFLTDQTFNSLDLAACGALAALAVGTQSFVRRRARPPEPRLSEREYPTAYAGEPSLDLIRADCARSAELSRSRRGLAA